MSCWPVSGDIVDPFVVGKFAPELADVPIPRANLRDAASRAAWPSSDITSHLFRKDDQRAERERVSADLKAWLANLTEWNISQAQIPLPSTAPDAIFDQLAEHGDRVFLSIRVDPNDGMDAVKRIRELARRYPNVRSVSLSPFMTLPLIAPNSREYYPIYAACVEEELAAFINVGFPGPRVPASVQDPIHLDDVCWFFPELTVVMRHGGQPWIETCVQMLLRWPNLYYATTAYAPKHYARQIIDLLNTRGRDKIIWAGYFPILGYERLSAEVGELPIRPQALEPFLRDNARRAFRLPLPGTVVRSS